MTTADIAKLRELLPKISPPPFGVTRSSSGTHINSPGGHICQVWGASESEDANADFIALARNLLPALLAERDQLTAALEKAVAAMKLAVKAFLTDVDEPLIRDVKVYQLDGALCGNTLNACREAIDQASAAPKA